MAGKLGNRDPEKQRGSGINITFRVDMELYEAFKKKVQEDQATLQHITTWLVKRYVEGKVK